MDGHRRLNLPPVFTTVPTRDKVVFLTIDDGEVFRRGIIGTPTAQARTATGSLPL